MLSENNLNSWFSPTNFPENNNKIIVKRLWFNQLVIVYLLVLIWMISLQYLNDNFYVFKLRITIYNVRVTSIKSNCQLRSVKNNWWGKLVSLSLITFDDNLKTTSVSFFIADLNLLSCESDSFTFKLLYCVIFIWIRIKLIKQNHIQWNCVHKTFTVPCENSKTVSFISSIIKNIVVFPSLSKFATKLICWIALGSAWSDYCLLKSIAIIL